MFSIAADYFGGDPDAVPYISHEGSLSLDEGVISFTLEYFETGTATANMMAAKKGETRSPIVIGPDSLVSIGMGDANHMRTLTRAVVGSMIGGDIGGLVGAGTSVRNNRLAIVYQRDHGPVSVVFGVDASSARRFIDLLQGWRRDAGLTTRDLAAVGATSGAGDTEGSPSPAGDGLLIEIRDLLSEIRDLLRLSRL